MGSICNPREDNSLLIFKIIATLVSLVLQLSLGPVVQPLFSVVGLSPAVTNAVLVGIYAGTGVVLWQTWGYSI